MSVKQTFGSPLSSVLGATIALAMVGLMGCADLGTDPSTATSASQNQPQQSADVSFQNHIRPIFQSHGCVGCHGGSGGLSLQTVAQLLQGGSHGAAIVAGKAGSSTLIAKLSPNPPFGSRMPLGGPYLPDSTIQLIAQWINQGAKDN